NGVVVEHRALMNFCSAAIRHYGLSGRDRILQGAPLIFDAALEEILPGWLVGATVVLRSEEMTGDVRLFLDVCETQSITVIGCSTAFWQVLTQQMHEERLTLPGSVRLVIIGGEAAHTNDVLRWRERVGTHVSLMNTYGPTEATVVATMCDLARADETVL